MPALLVATVRYGECREYGSTSKGYLLKIEELTRYYPDLEANYSATAYILEIYNSETRRLHVFKPPQRIYPRIVSIREIDRWKLGLKLPDDFINKHGIAQGYYVVLLITKVGAKTIFPYEVKVLTDAPSDITTRLTDCYSTIGLNILKLFHLLDNGKPELAKAMQFLVDGYHRYINGDLEGSITQLRKAVQVLRDDVLPKIHELEGIKKLKGNLKDITKDLDNLIGGIIGIVKKLYNTLSIGGPHPGPVPREAALLAFKFTLSLIEYLARVA